MSEQVKEMFSSIAHRYDTTNTVLSGGTHHLWRKKVVQLSRAKPGDDVLDCATGTGDLAIEFKHAVGSKGTVLATDFCEDMMVYGREKALQENLNIKFEVADAMELPYTSNSYDIASISFGIRNVDDPKVCLEEMARVVRPNGRVMVLEFGQPKGSLFGPLYRFYSKYIIPKIGGLLTGNPDAYAYLPETAAAFPAGADFLALMESTDLFQETKATPLMGGIAYIYLGVVR